MFIFRTKKSFIHCEDEALIKEIEAGNEAAFNELYQRYGEKIFRYFYRLLNQDKEKAEDFLQDFFIKLLAALPHYKEEQKLSTWLYTIAGNMCRNEWRNSLNRAKILDELRYTLPKESHTDIEKIDSQFSMKALESSISNLAELDQELLALRFQQELSIKEIGEILQIPEGTVKSKLFYLIKKLSIQLKVYNPIKN